MSSLLSGIKVLDLSRILAGPWSTQMLADFGAEVTKVEPPQGDETRRWGPPFIDDRSGYYLCANRNKKLRIVDYKNQTELQQLRQDLHQFDVIVENYRPGTLDKFDLDYESCRKLNPKIIYCSVRGYPEDSVDHDRPGFDAIIQAVAGMMSVTGFSDGLPTKAGVAISDLFTGFYAANGIMAALIERSRSGLGQRLQVSLFDSQVACLANVIQAFLVNQKILGKNQAAVPGRIGNDHAQIFPYGGLMVKNGMMMIAIGSDSQFIEFSTCLKQSWHNDLRFQKNSERVRYREQLRQLIEEILKEKTASEWEQYFSQFDFPFGSVQSIAEVLAAHPYLIVRDPKSGQEMIRNPIRFSRTPITQYLEAPKLTESILK